MSPAETVSRAAREMRGAVAFRAAVQAQTPAAARSNRATAAVAKWLESLHGAGWDGRHPYTGEQEHALEVARAYLGDTEGGGADDGSFGRKFGSWSSEALAEGVAGLEDEP